MFFSVFVVLSLAFLKLSYWYQMTDVSPCACIHVSLCVSSSTFRPVSALHSSSKSNSSVYRLNSWLHFVSVWVFDKRFCGNPIWVFELKCVCRTFTWPWNAARKPCALSVPVLSTIDKHPYIYIHYYVVHAVGLVSWHFKGSVHSNYKQML